MILFTLAGAVLVYLVLTGRLNWLVAAVGAILPLLPRLMRFLIGMAPTLLPFLRRYQQNRQSSMQTRFVRLRMNILTGELDGDILEGEFSGKSLQSLSLVELQQLLEKLREQDAESAALLIAYLDRVHPEWSGGESQQHGYTPKDGDMDEQEAREILGVSEAASRDDVIEAHRRLMQKMHPDRGGSDYLAQQINRARDLLLKSL